MSSRRPDEQEVRLPAALPAMWRLCRLGLRYEPRLMLWAFSLSLLAALPDALLALWLALLGNGVLARDPLRIGLAALALGVSTAGTWLLRTLDTRLQRRFRDRVTIALESHVARLQATVSTISHQERPDYLDRLAVLRDQVFVLDHMYMSLFTTSGWILRLAVTVGLLASIHPLLSLLVLFALPTVLTSAWRPAVERAVQERVARHSRLARHLFTLATTAPAGKEVRVTNLGLRLATGRRQAWQRWYAPIGASRWTSAVWYTLGWAVFAVGYIGAVLFVVQVLVAPAGSVLLVLAAGARLSAYISSTVGEIGFLRGVWMDGAIRLAWLEDYAASVIRHALLPAPIRLRRGIRLEHVSFAYPGTQRVVLEDINLEIPAGAVVALVGENGAGKTTLVKLLAKLYDPSAGAIYVDDVPLAQISTAEWRTRLAGAFQDFFRFELRAQQTVGLGDVPRLDQPPAVLAAVDRADAGAVVGQLSDGLQTQLGATWPRGVELSFGQWQKLALARGFMREAPLLLVLDEPTAALDAETEHALFERYAAAARRARDGDAEARATDTSGDTVTGTTADSGALTDDAETGGITLLVSHRFSTVRMADLIVVLDGSRVVEVGSHEDLMAHGGQYAELYNIQAAAYR